DHPIGQSETGKVSIDYKFVYLGKLEKLKITPVVIEGDQKVICPDDQAPEFENIPEC
ncbi:hypothetical protein HZA99_00740, partial [Candidatus Woesearchaeota archaeon]|nr:hypothetical protein [Candidatus Woesearchaeota archaeon]